MIKQKLLQLLASKRARKIARAYDKKTRQFAVPATIATEAIREEHVRFWSSFSGWKTNRVWLDWYVASTGFEHAGYVPESIYYSLIEPILNDYSLCDAWGDKNIYDLLYPATILPKTLVRRINGPWLDPAYRPIGGSDLLAGLPQQTDLIVKPSIESGGGSNVQLFAAEGGLWIDSAGHALSPKSLGVTSSGDLVVQERLQQHVFFEKFNASSVNTVRVLTYRGVISGEIHILHSVLRVGVKGDWVDNSRAGGYSIGVRSDGTLNTFGCTKDGVHHTWINDVDLEAHTLSIPEFGRILQCAKDIAQKNVHHRLLGLDMMLDRDGNPRCIEINNRGNEINFYQLNNGTLFGEHTQEVVDYCKANRHRLYQSYTI